MTINEIIAKVDELEPNQYSYETKMGWLSTLDGELYEEVVKTHVPENLECDPRERLWRGNPLNQDIPERVWRPVWPEFVPYTDGDDELLAGPPYGAPMYEAYLKSKIAAENAEIGKYNAQIILFNSAQLSFINWYNRNHMPLQPAHGNRILF